jgi:hypothetical protein
VPERSLDRVDDGFRDGVGQGRLAGDVPGDPAGEAFGVTLDHRQQNRVPTALEVAVHGGPVDPGGRGHVVQCHLGRAVAAEAGRGGVDDPVAGEVGSSRFHARDPTDRCDKPQVLSRATLYACRGRR